MTNGHSRGDGSLSPNGTGSDGGLDGDGMGMGDSQGSSEGDQEYYCDGFDQDLRRVKVCVHHIWPVLSVFWKVYFLTKWWWWAWLFSFRVACLILWCWSTTPGHCREIHDSHHIPSLVSSLPIYMYVWLLAHMFDLGLWTRWLTLDGSRNRVLPRQFWRWFTGSEARCAQRVEFESSYPQYYNPSGRRVSQTTRYSDCLDRSWWDGLRS